MITKSKDVPFRYILGQMAPLSCGFSHAVHTIAYSVITVCKALQLSRPSAGVISILEYSLTMCESG